MALAAALSAVGSYALVMAPRAAGLVASRHAYAAIVWILALWTVVHVGVGVVMHLYCVARRIARRMTARHELDLSVVSLYWHFVAVTAAVTVAVTAGFSRLV